MPSSQDDGDLDVNDDGISDEIEEAMEGMRTIHTSLALPTFSLALLSG